MVNKYVGAAKNLVNKLTPRSKKVAPTITQPKQLKTTMKKIKSKYNQFGGEKAKTAADRANIVRRRASIKRMDKVDKLQEKRKEGIKASKEIKKMKDTGKAHTIYGRTFHKSVKEIK